MTMTIDEATTTCINPRPPRWLVPALYGLITVHMSVVLGFVCSFFVLPFKAPWYISTPLMTFIWFFSTTRVECQCTNLENRWRQRAGWPRISTFVGHYLVKPAYRKILRKNRKRS